MDDRTDPLTERISDLGAELNRHLDWICESLFRAEVEGANHRAYDNRRLHWETAGRAEAYQEILLLVFGLNWMDISQRRVDHQAAARSKAKAG